VTSISSDSTALMEAAALRIATACDEAIAARGRFTFALSGGSTPRGLYELLASEAFATRARHMHHLKHASHGSHVSIDWSRVEFFWGDERCVPPDHPDSNYRMARESLLERIAADPARVHRMRGEELPERGAAAYEALLHDCFAVAPGGPPPVFDLILLGMGADGHTASLFPGTAALGERTRWVVDNRAEPSGMERLTLTFPVLNAASNVLFLVSGADKAARVKQVLERTPGADALPASRIQPVRGQLEWMLDRAAASQLTAATTNHSQNGA
jgi:6-phosphogluconolactonase